MDRQGELRTSLSGFAARLRYRLLGEAKQPVFEENLGASPTTTPPPSECDFDAKALCHQDIIAQLITNPSNDSVNQSIELQTPANLYSHFGSRLSDEVANPVRWGRVVVGEHLDGGAIYIYIYTVYVMHKYNKWEKMEYCLQNAD